LSFSQLVIDELSKARQQHPGKQHSAHEGYAVLLEEVDEVKALVWGRARDEAFKAALKKELIQVAAMAQRTAEDLEL
jgi:NTP pyrophosphatase (non-canonical NTP hydrolase)